MQKMFLSYICVHENEKENYSEKLLYPSNRYLLLQSQMNLVFNIIIN